MDKQTVLRRQRKINAVISIIIAISLLLGACGAAADPVGREEPSAERPAAIPDAIEEIPDGYFEPAKEQGALEDLYYDTWESFSYEEKTQSLQKHAVVYLPYGYDESQRYDVFYLMHGGWGNENQTLGTPDAPSSFKNVIDNAIENGDFGPLIIVCPTYNNTSPEDSASFSLALQLNQNLHRELINDLLPAVEGRYSTYAEGTSASELMAARDHRGFGGFSMGSVATWRTFQNCMDYFRWYLPMSCGTTLDDDNIFAAAEGREPEDFFAFIMTGTDDFAYSYVENRVDKMRHSDLFSENINFAYRAKEGYTHGGIASMEYTYNGLKAFFGGAQSSPATASAAYTADTPVSDVMTDSVFGDYGRLIFPVDEGYWSGDTLGELRLTWYNYIDPDKTVEICNYMRNHAAAGDVIFYDIYSEDEKAADPAKRDTGLFFFRGEPGARFAVCNAGGGFAYVGAMHDSFPHALELSKMGYNAFALIYRPGWDTAIEDLARAVSFIFDHAEELQLDTSCYSVWGGSAGARMAAELGTYGPGYFGGGDLPGPGAVIMQYTGHTEYSEDDPPTYACVGTSDGIANWRTMQNRLSEMSALGIPTEFHAYEGLPHGFGLGTGTVAEGWINDAVAFWENQMATGGLVREQILDGSDGPIHYSYILPDGYDPAQKYPLVMTMPGYGQMWFGEDSSGSNVDWNGFRNWTRLDEPVIVVSAQLEDWNDRSARQANELAEYFIDNFPVDTSRVYAAGYSAGGETMSRAVSMRPDLYAAYLHVSSQWDGDYAPLAENRVVVYIFMGEDDEYYGSGRARDAYAGLTEAYRAAGMTDSEINELIVLNIPGADWFSERGVTNQHGGGNLIFEDMSVLEWITDNGAPHFRDVPEGSEYAEAVKYVYEHGLMAGTGKDTFSPDAPLSRAMIVTILHRAEESPEAPAADFSDVPGDTWYSEAVGWAAERGIVYGVGGGRFAPEDALTRGQLDLILSRFSGEGTGVWDPRGDTTIVTRGEAAQRLMEYFESRDAAAKPHLGDLPEAYSYGEWSFELMNKKLPEPKDGATVLNTAADPTDIQVLYLWEEGNVPAVTDFTPGMTGYFDNWDFRPYVTAIPVRDGVTPKGAVVLMAGGAYQFRGNYTDSLPVADALRELGFVTFIVDYRLRPYDQEEGALDVARAVRWIRKNADVYGFDPDNIAVMGFSAGGIQAGEFLMHYDEDVTGDALDPAYIPDELDKVPAHATACGMIYAFYGRLSVGNMDPDWLRSGDLPPTFYCYGTEDPFYRQFEQQYAVLEGMGHPVDRVVLQDWPHGFGAAGGWVETYADWLESVWNS